MTVISDKQRREVAENLRYLTIGSPVRYKEQFFDELADVVLDVWEPWDFNILFEKLADLIDPEGGDDD